MAFYVQAHKHAASQCDEAGAAPTKEDNKLQESTPG